VHQQFADLTRQTLNARVRAANAIETTM